MTDLKIYGINITALIASSPMVEGINPVLQTIVLLLTIGYTSINIYQKLKK
jgi:hypothetical protein|tara:strand:+ start:375 stop:527 length:153 start_codon:yes stop_codon:yes gene_type:complete